MLKDSGFWINIYLHVVEQKNLKEMEITYD